MVGGLVWIQGGMQMINEHISSSRPRQLYAECTQVCGAEPGVATGVDLLKGTVVKGEVERHAVIAASSAYLESQ
jgi:hypothetical protein